MKRKNTVITSIDPSTNKNVEISGVTIPFWQLMGFMLKCVLASIPSLIILTVVILVIIHLFKEYVSVLF